MSVPNERRMDCRTILSQLEDVAGAESGAKNRAELVAGLPVDSQNHVATCVACGKAADSMLVTRAALSPLASRADLGGPWFASRVMAAIAARKAELARAADTWTFLPRLAARLTWASSVVLLLASAWLYQRPYSAPQTQAKVAATDITGEPLENSNASTNDDVLVNLAEKAPALR